MLCYGSGCIRFRIKIAEAWAAVSSTVCRTNRSGHKHRTCVGCYFICPAQHGADANKHVAVWRLGLAIFLLITGGDISRGPNRRDREWEKGGHGFLMDENISEDRWHSNSQGLTAWVMDRGEGWRKITQIQECNRETRSSDQYGVTKIHHTHAEWK